jgi:hypothetical protein
LSARSGLAASACQHAALGFARRLLSFSLHLLAEMLRSEGLY